ncbi:MAG: radical SAM protein, partial [Planctomycetota bacterium]
MRLPWTPSRRRRSSLVKDAVRAAALRVYREVAQRDPLEEEVTRAAGAFGDSVGDLRAQEQAISEGDVDRHLGVRAFNVKMDVINQCNIRCKMCHFNDPAYSYVNLPKKEMTVESFARIAEEVFPYTGDLSLSASTEPLLHGNFSQLLEIVARYRVPHVMMHTNALLMTEEFAESIVRGGMNHISISIDGATPETYEEIRRGGKFD